MVKCMTKPPKFLAILIAFFMILYSCTGDDKSLRDGNKNQNELNFKDSNQSKEYQQLEYSSFQNQT